MIQLRDISWDLSHVVRLAQFGVDRGVNPGVNPVEQAALAFSGPKFFVALISGFLLAFAFQVLLTNLSVALGISILGHGSDDHHDHHHSDHEHSGSVGGTVKKIGFAVGIWTLITVTVSLFFACLLGVKLSLLSGGGLAGLGAIIGLVIWAAYFMALVWVSSTTVGSLIGSVVNTATSGFQTLVGATTAAIGAQAVNRQVVSTAEAAAAAVRRELGAGLDPASIRDRVEDYLDRVRPAQLDMRRVRGELERLVNDPELQNIVGSGSPADVVERLRNVDRSTFINLISNRTDLSKQEANRLVDQLDSVWKDTIGRFQRKDPTQDLAEYLKTVQPGQVNTDELNRRLDELTQEVRRQGQLLQQNPQQPDAMSNMRDPLTSMASMGQGAKPDQPGLINQAVQMGFGTLMSTVLGRGDLSDLDVEKIINQIKGARDKVVDGAKQVADTTSDRTPSGFSAIRADVENYLLNTYSWHFNRETLDNEFREVLHDPEADPAQVRRDIERLNRGDFVNLLTQRGDLPVARVAEIADQLETIRSSVLGTVRTHEESETVQDVQNRLEHYLRTIRKEDLTPDTIEREITSIVHDSDADYDTLKSRLDQLDHQTVIHDLLQRQDLTPEEADLLATQFETARDRALTTAQTTQNRVRSEAGALRARVESYLRNTNKNELNPDGIQRDFKLLLDDPQAGASALRGRLSQFDRETLVQLLAQRQDITPEEADRIVGQLEDVRNRVLNAPQRVANKAKDQVGQITTQVQDQASQVTTQAKDQVDQVLATIENYLRNTNKEALDPDGIKRDLNTLMQDPKVGALRLRARLSQIDRDTLVALLSQRQDLSPDQVNQTIDQVQETIRGLSRSPRRLASRAQQRIMNFETAFENYLRNTDKYELNPDGIKRDLQLLLSDRRTGASNLRERLAHIDRNTVVALLAQRKDMTEEEANRIVDQVLSVRQQAMAQIQAIQDRVTSIIEGILDRIRHYLNGLERPELNYEGIRDDVRTLFHDPQAGFGALRDRLGSFNRETLVALLASREDISEADANRIIDQIEHSRMNVLRRAERLQEEAQRRVEEVRRQAKKQAEETRKAAATAAWWLFATAVVSAIAAAIAGAIAVA